MLRNGLIKNTLQHYKNTFSALIRQYRQIKKMYTVSYIGTILQYE